ncbi:hypothetical protein MN116_003584 [Schistosoma mekongi]|uniref:Ran-specific GTPase-activating protein n=1 Tax=Schistosoma mekongi TaxID=38744 RepID=A0AAE1ZF56_SCHME|nr:hypothetical protein MN116_003584 [Schistosoma mekongi]
MLSVSEHEDSDLYFEPLITLPPLTVSSSEENEECLFKQRAQLFRFDTVEDPPEWKERGVGVLKILRNKTNGSYRLLMRRDRTYKVCANHYLLKSMYLRPNCSSARAFVWSTVADFADEVLKPELLGVRFANSTFASEFRKVFEEGCQATEEKLTDDRSSVEGAHSDKEDKINDVYTLSNSIKESLTITTSDNNSCDHVSTKTDA